jgi:hypothetical protein
MDGRKRRRPFEIENLDVKKTYALGEGRGKTSCHQNCPFLVK